MKKKKYEAIIDLPDNFQIPVILETEKYRIRPLTINDAVKDYDAVMTSIEYIKSSRGTGNNWPTIDLTLEQDIIDLAWHQNEFRMKSSFAYTVMSLDEQQCLGCIYLYANDKEEFDVEISMWVRASEAPHGLRKHLYTTVKNWVAGEWPFENPEYLGKEE